MRRLSAIILSISMVLAPAAGIRAYAYEISDYMIEWDEVSDIITGRNPTYTLILSSADESIADMQDAVSEDIMTLKSSLETADETIEELKKALEASGGGTPALKAGLDTALSLRGELYSSLSSMGSVSRSLKYTARDLPKTLSSARYQLEAALKTLIITYKTLEVNMSMLDAQISLYERLYESAVRLGDTGLSTDADTESYRLNAESARLSRESVKSAMSLIKGNILVLSGYSPDDEVEIADLPAADTGYLGSRDIDNDRNTAVSGNAAVIARESISGYTGDVFKYRDANLAVTRAEAAAAFNKICAALEEETILAASAETSLRKAELMSESAERKYSLGLISASEYMALRLECIAAEAAVKLNELGLHEAIVNYDYALKGVMSVE